MSWTPQRSLSETDAVLCAPGNPHEIETSLVGGRLYRVYKHLWPSLRDFWLWAASEYSNRTYIVFQDQRLTYRDVFDRSVKAASLFRTYYGIQKGDRVGICSRNCPDYITAFWACHLLGAVSVLVNAWLPLDPLRFCLEHTECKLVLLDPERADLLEPVAADLIRTAGTTGLLVFDSLDGKGHWKDMQSFNYVMDHYPRDPSASLATDPNLHPEDNASIMFTSGTTGLPKGVLSTQRMFLTNLRNISVGVLRAKLRNGEELPSPKEGPQQGVLVAVPLFHVTGSTSLSMLATMNGQKVVLMRKWNVEDAVRLIKRENISVGGGVPTMVSDLTESSLAGHHLDALIFGGAAAPSGLPAKARKSFPAAILSQTYGMTETNSISVACAGNDYLVRPSSTGLPSPVNDIMIVQGDTSVPAGQRGEVWLRGPNVMKEYWRDPEATAKALTSDGWLRTGDLGSLDEDGFLYIHDRIKDIIIRGGENISSVSVENALYEDSRILEAAAVGVPDERLGELVAAVVSVKPAFYGQVTEDSLVKFARQRLPRFAVPVMVLVQDSPLEHTPSEKITKGVLRKLAHVEWKTRQMDGMGGLVCTRL
ncbi:hypothetical protein HGRIS_002116 [Hohenbuehelia grisea]|uniref:Uncharacterized protein n=1 Tax=Hohenbuehelia grisea TaxID=104357 RepID=A0ABR3JJH1_9AGAR